MYKKLLVPVDGSSTSQLGLVEAIRLAKQLKASLRIVHVVDEFVADSTMGPAMYYDKWVEALREGGKKTLADAQVFAKRHDCEPEAVLVETIGRRAADVIIEQVKQWPADLIVMGTHGRRGLRRLVMGSDAELVVRSSPVPVLLVREQIEAIRAN
jgi:nucleotide-binding universal stress UspA family protein